MSELNRSSDETMEAWLARLRAAASRPGGVATTLAPKRGPRHQQLRRRQERTALGSRIRAMREGRGWCQADLADAAGVHMMTIQNVERGVVAEPSLSAFAGIARAFGVSMDGLFYGSAALERRRVG